MSATNAATANLHHRQRRPRRRHHRTPANATRPATQRPLHRHTTLPHPHLSYRHASNHPVPQARSRPPLLAQVTTPSTATRRPHLQPHAPLRRPQQRITHNQPPTPTRDRAVMNSPPAVRQLHRRATPRPHPCTRNTHKPPPPPSRSPPPHRAPATAPSTATCHLRQASHAPRPPQRLQIQHLARARPLWIPAPSHEAMIARTAACLSRQHMRHSRQRQLPTGRVPPA